MKKLVLIFAILILFGNSSFAEGFPAIEIYQKTSKAVVLIIAQKGGKRSMLGAGSIITDSGIVITNAHVVIDKNTSRPFSNIRVYLKPEKVTGKFKRDLVNRHKASVIAFDSNLDIAILKIGNLPSDTGIIELANSEEIKIGEEVVAIGHPEQGGLWTLTYGRISGGIDNLFNIEGKDVFQTDTSVNRGNSGGPLLDRRGYMVAVNSNIARLGAGNLPITGVNFAIKSSVVKKWLNKNGYMIAYGKKPLIKEDKVFVVGPTESPQEKVEKTGVKPETDKKMALTEEQEVEPQDKKEKAETTKEKKKIEDKDKSMKAKVKEPTDIPKEKFYPPKRPYDYDALLKATEQELEDLMDEMKQKIKKSN